jgi:hypothetical protein
LSGAPWDSGSELRRHAVVSKGAMPGGGREGSCGGTMRYDGRPVGRVLSRRKGHRGGQGMR